jgi:beta-lactam-binding protein with PASTA domain
VAVTNNDDIIDVFRRGPELVCATRPDGGAQVKPGSKVELVVSKTC